MNLDIKDPEKLIAYLARHYPQSFNRYSLSPQRIAVYKLVVRARQPVMSRLIADHFDMDIRQASALLYQLYQKHFLARERYIQPSGGFAWLYSVVE